MVGPARRARDLHGSGKSLAFWLPALTAVRADAAARVLDPGRIESVARRGAVLYLSPTKALAADQLSGLQRLLDAAGTRDVRVATCDGDTAQDERRWVREHADVVLTNPDFLHFALLPHHRGWTRLLRTCGTSSWTRGTPTGGVRRARLPRPAAPAAARRALRARGRPASDVRRRVGDDRRPRHERGTARRGRARRRRDRRARHLPAGRKTFALWSRPSSWASRRPRTPGRRRVTTTTPRSRRPPRDPSTRAAASRPRRPTCSPTSSSRAPARSRSRARGAARSPSRSRRRTACASSTPARAPRRRLPGRVPARGAARARGRGAHRRRAGPRDDQRPRAGRRHLGARRRAHRGLARHPHVGVAAGGPRREGGSRRPRRVRRARGPARHVPRAPPRGGVRRAARGDRVRPSEPLRPRAAPVRGGGRGAAAVGGPRRVRRARRGARPARRARRARSPATPGLRLVLDPRAARVGHDRPAWVRGAPVRVAEARTGRLLGTVDAASADGSVHDGAVYVHQGRTYVVEHLDLADHVALVRRQDVDHGTWSRSTTSITIVDEPTDGDVATGRDVVERSWGPVGWGYGPVDVCSQVVSFQRRRLLDMQVLGTETLDLPERTLPTMAVWWTVPASVIEEAGVDADELPGALHAAEHASIGLLPSSRRATAGTSAGCPPRCTPTPARPPCSSTTPTPAEPASPSAGSSSARPGSARPATPSRAARATTAARRACSRPSAARTTRRSRRPPLSGCSTPCSRTPRHRRHRRRHRGRGRGRGRPCGAQRRFPAVGHCTLAGSRTGATRSRTAPPSGGPLTPGHAPWPPSDGSLLPAAAHRSPAGPVRWPPLIARSPVRRVLRPSRGRASPRGT